MLKFDVYLNNCTRFIFNFRIKGGETIQGEKEKWRTLYGGEVFLEGRRIRDTLLCSFFFFFVRKIHYRYWTELIFLFFLRVNNLYVCCANINIISFVSKLCMLACITVAVNGCIFSDLFVGSSMAGIGDIRYEL